MIELATIVAEFYDINLNVYINFIYHPKKLDAEGYFMFET